MYEKYQLSIKNQASVPEDMHDIKGENIDESPAHGFADQGHAVADHLGVLLHLLQAETPVQVVLHEHEAGLAECARRRGEQAVLKLVGHLAKLHDRDEGGEGWAHDVVGGAPLPGGHPHQTQHRVCDVHSRFCSH